jgi:D-glycero-alpha-D-manno-heptose-7-phosphate kinase
VIKYCCGYKPISAKKILEKSPVVVSAPCRVDSGGTWDMKAMAIPHERLYPVTINIALSLRTHVTLSPFKDGYIKIASEGFKGTEKYNIENNIPFNSPFAIFLAAINLFGFHGISVNIRSDSPVRSALGGSSTALIALIKALSDLQTLIGGKGFSKRQILHLGYHIEDGINGGNCGIQDQAAAVYGGVNLWRWRFSNMISPFIREPLLDAHGLKEISKCMIVAYSGKSHVSARTNRSWITDFLSGKTRSGWIKANEVVKGLADVIKGKDWDTASYLLREEMKIRRAITPDALIPLTSGMIHQAEQMGCGARFAGAGAGGSLWALGPQDKIKDVRSAWGDTLRTVNGASILECNVVTTGAR